MTECAKVATARSAFDPFLLASIGADNSDNGMQLSVLSALARQGIDPWEEAAHLAYLPSSAAAQKLAELIAAMPDERSIRLDPGRIAARLVALLPPRAASTDTDTTANTPANADAPVQWQGGRAPAASPAGGAGPSRPVRQLIIYGVCMALMFALQWLMFDRPTGTAPIEVVAPASSAAVPDSPPR